MSTEANQKYPKREPFYAHKLTRLLFNSCAAQSLGQDAVLLIIHIAHAEDAVHYKHPVRFWNSQLNEVLGFRSPKSLNNARRKAVESGWLKYDRKNDRADGIYFTCIPDHVLEFNDMPSEPVPSTESFPSTEREGYALRNGKEKGNDPPPNPNPIPSPAPVNASRLNASSSSSLNGFSFSREDRVWTLKEIETQANRLLALIPKSDRKAASSRIWNYAYGLLLVGAEAKVGDVVDGTTVNADNPLKYIQGAVRRSFAESNRDWVETLPEIPIPPDGWPYGCMDRVKPISREVMRNRIVAEDRKRWLASEAELQAEVDRRISLDLPAVHREKVGA